MARRKKKIKVNTQNRYKSEMKLLRGKLKQKYANERYKIETLEQTIRNLNNSLDVERQKVRSRDESCQSLQREKQQHYDDSNKKTVKIARLESVIVSLREGAQKILTGFNSLA